MLNKKELRMVKSVNSRVIPAKWAVLSCYSSWSWLLTRKSHRWIALVPMFEGYFERLVTLLFAPRGTDIKDTSL